MPRSSSRSSMRTHGGCPRRPRRSRISSGRRPGSVPDRAGARRSWVIALFAVAGLFILATAEHFAQALVDTGTQVGISQFLLVQWVAPLASESPELIVACLYAVRLKASHALGTLLSSKVN